ncbi:hypothetical protein PCANC_11446 [Puccinia coronata f. sp. avenae]|uniref:BRCT domain-containing protein n=1 Tax=Puccinia coronata f. sp. avenae TaxID=200324 RepID=A0A2N5VCP4_9BASI|nr:hypothetical protein PCANC_11446 [Puccinia coronata f. sp. avenae]
MAHELTPSTEQQSQKDDATREQETEPEDSYMSELLGRTQKVPSAAAEIAPTGHTTTTPPSHMRSHSLAVLGKHSPILDLHFPVSFTLGPETQKARLSMENHARMQYQDLDMTQPPFQSQQTPSGTTPEEPLSENPSHNLASIPLQSTQPQAMDRAPSPHPPDVTIELTFQEARMALDPEDTLPPPLDPTSPLLLNSIPTPSESNHALQSSPPAHLSRKNSPRGPLLSPKSDPPTLSHKLAPVPLHQISQVTSPPPDRPLETPAEPRSISPALPQPSPALTRSSSPDTALDHPIVDTQRVTTIKHTPQSVQAAQPSSSNPTPSNALRPPLPLGQSHSQPSSIITDTNCVGPVRRHVSSQGHAASQKRKRTRWQSPPEERSSRSTQTGANLLCDPSSVAEHPDGSGERSSSVSTRASSSRGRSVLSAQSGSQQSRPCQISPAVSVVIPRFPKSKAAVPTRPKAPRAAAPVRSHPLVNAVLPVQQRVLAYRADWEGFAPGEVCGVTLDKVVVRYDAETGARAELGAEQLRLCHMGAGDMVKYIGTDLAEGESQRTSVRDPKRVLRVEKAAGAELADTPINSSGDLLVVCDETDFKAFSTAPSLNAIPENRLARFLVEAVVLISPRSRPHMGFKDRLLPQQIIRELRELMKAHSGVGMRAKSAAPTTTTTNHAPSLPGVSRDRIFDGFGILLTGFTTVPVPASKGGTRKRPATSAQRRALEQQIRAQHGTVISEVSELYELQGSDLGLAAFDSPPHHDVQNDSYRLLPASKHMALASIILVADAPLKTLKYLVALALGIPCVSSRWISHSCEQRRALDWRPYMMGPGPSLFLGGVPPLLNLQISVASRGRHDLQGILDARAPLQILAGKTLVYVAAKAKAKSDWAESVRPILCACGASRVGFAGLKDVRKMLKEAPPSSSSLLLLESDGGGGGVDYVVLEDHMSVGQLSLPESSANPDPPKPRKKAKLERTHSNSSSSLNLFLPPNLASPFRAALIVDFEWLKQSIIAGRLLPPQFFATHHP